MKNEKFYLQNIFFAPQCFLGLQFVWLKNKGDKVSSDEPIVELETDKVNVEVPSPSNGVLDSISVKEGETVNVGALLGLISKSKSTSISTESDSGEKKYSPPKLEKDKTEIESKLDVKLSWQPLPNRSASRIKLYKENCDLYDESKWSEYIDWSIEKLEKFHNVFSSKLKTLD